MFLYERDVGVPLAMVASSWLDSLSVVADRILQSALIGHAVRGSPLPTTWVTDLIDPRPAYWRRVHPVPPGPDRAERMASGRRLHEAIGASLAPRQRREVRVRRGGVVGQVDLFEDVPTEIKTTGRGADAGGSLDPRPEHLDQLGMYCALVDHPAGRLLVVTSSPDTPRGTAWDATFTELPTILDRMAERSRTLQSALSARDPTALPRCHWYGRGCEFQGAGVCNCTGAETEPSSLAQDRLADLAENPAETGRLEAAARAAVGWTPPVPRDARDLVFPRRAFLDRRAAAQPASEVRASRPRNELWATVRDLVADAGVGEVAQRFVPGEVPPEPIGCLDGDPILIKTLRSWPPPTVEDLRRRQPHYFLDVACRTRLLGGTRGRLVLGLERASSWEDRLRVFEITVQPPSDVDAMLRDRLRGFEDARKTGDSRVLPACPTWMFANCPYREFCGCGSGAEPSRDHR